MSMVLVWAGVAAWAEPFFPVFAASERADGIRFDVVDFFVARPLDEGVEATGEPVWIDVRVGSELVKVTEKVGDVTYKDSKGNSIGSAEVFEDRTYERQFLVWQGTRPSTTSTSTASRTHPTWRIGWCARVSGGEGSTGSGSSPSARVPRRSSRPPSSRGELARAR
jgi:hypothetical protein